MYRGIFVSLAIAIVISSAALGDIGQSQFSFDRLDNNVTMLGGIGGGSSAGFVMTNKQETATDINWTFATQNQFVGLGQAANAGGVGAVITAGGWIQAGNLDGIPQRQQVSNDSADKTQGQSLGLGAATSISKTGGPGGADVKQVGVLCQSQTSSNPYGVATESCGIVAAQKAETVGAAGSSINVSSGVSAQSVQSQWVN